jgi:hypothetical protein
MEASPEMQSEVVPEQVIPEAGGNSICLDFGAIYN